MYPRNSASPERIAIGPVVLIADGTVQNSGVSVKVKPQGAAASAGGGTISYEEGIVAYLPTQAETNYTSFQLIAYKADCIPATVTVVTSATDVAGTVDIGRLGGSATAGTNLKNASLAMASGTVLADGSNTATTFKIDSTLGAKAADYFGDANGGMVLTFVDGTTNEWIGKRVVAFNTTTDFVTVEEAFPATPTASDGFILIGRITELS